MLRLQSKEKNILDRSTEKHRQAADRQGQTAALDGDSVYLSGWTLWL